MYYVASLVCLEAFMKQAWNLSLLMKMNLQWKIFCNAYFTCIYSSLLITAIQEASRQLEICNWMCWAGTLHARISDISITDWSEWLSVPCWAALLWLQFQQELCLQQHLLYENIVTLRPKLVYGLKTGFRKTNSIEQKQWVCFAVKHTLFLCLSFFIKLYGFEIALHFIQNWIMLDFFVFWSPL